MRRIVARHLANHGRVALEASSVQEALTCLEKLEAPVDLITTDWDLLDEDGLSLIASVRESQPEVPVLIITARNAQGDVQKALEAGIQGYLLKPINGELLQERLGKILPTLPEPAEEKPKEASTESPGAEPPDSDDSESGEETPDPGDGSETPEATDGKSEAEVKEAA